MKYGVWYLKLRFLTIKNAVWKDHKTRITAILLFVLLLGFMAGFTYVIQRFMIGESLQDRNVIVLSIFLLFAVIWVFISSFFQSLSSFPKSFLHSPELNYLMTLPIPTGQLFLFKFIDHLFLQIKGSLFLFVPFFAAIGLGIQAPWYYYVLILPIYAVVTIIPSSVGVFIALFAMRLFTIKQYTMMTSTLSILTNILFAFYYARIDQLQAEWMIEGSRWLNESILASILPMTSGIVIFAGLLIQRSTWIAWMFLFLISLMFLVGIYYLSKKVYVYSWSKNQDVTPKSKTKTPTTTKRKRRTHHNPLWEWMKCEWQMALRNHEMIMGTVFMLFFFVGTLLYFVIAKPYPEEPLLGLFLIITIAVIFNVMATSIVFIPAEVAVDKSIWKKQHWILKTLPLHSSRIFFMRMVMFWIPTFVITTVGMIVFFLTYQVALIDSILLLLYTGVLLIGSVGVYVSVELVALTESFERHPFYANLMTFIAPIGYGLLSSGIVMLSLGVDDIFHVQWSHLLQSIFQFEILMIVSVIVGIVSVFVSKKVFDYAWKAIEV